MRHTRFYNIWCGMKSRCFNPNSKDYKNYGYKGITISNSWRLFSNFMKDMLISYKEHEIAFGEKNTTLDRINVKGSYSKENCRWATKKEQCINKASYGMDKRKRDKNGKFKKSIFDNKVSSTRK